jgi:hypothetical protein
VVGTPVGTVYSNPVNATIGTDANFVFGGNGRSWDGTGTPVLAATYGGVEMTASATRLYAYSARAAAAFWLINPLTGVRAFSRSNSGTGVTTDRGAIICSLKDVNVSDAIGAQAQNFIEDDSTTPTVTVSSNANALALAYLYSPRNATVTAGPDETIVATYYEDSLRHTILSKPGAESVSFAPTISLSATWAIFAVSVNGTAADSTPSRITLSFRPPA